jgi:7-cyano-7-deazaguanine synthase in queuosine biosynthesis
MPDYELRMTMPKSISKAKARSTFYWTPTGGDSFIRTYGPSLGGLGPVAPLNVDLVRLAVAAYAADLSTPRAADGSNWSQRELNLTVPVSDPSRWEALADRLGELLGFLSGDAWTLRFVAARKPKESIASAPARPARVVLLSGGADSAVGALVSRHELGEETHALVSHFSATFLSSVQRSIVAEIARLIRQGPDQNHCVIRLTRRSEQPNGTRLANEYSTRSRSLLFIALGLAVASVHQVPLQIPENGFASLNPPLGPHRRGSLSTRTTHPFFLDGLRALLEETGVHAELSNPFQSLTKGEIFRRAADVVGSANASTLLGQTLSCAHTGHKVHGYSTKVGCGVCFGCLVRKAAFAASGIEDRSDYLPLSDPKLSNYLANKSAERSLELFLEDGINAADIAAMSLPTSYQPRDALALCQRAMDELRLLFR